jgi:carbamate kinase
MPPGDESMSETIVILVDGEVLADSRESTIGEQKGCAGILAEGLRPVLNSELQIAILHGNKPQVGYVLFRSELASHMLHPIPLDVCGADTQGATGYMLTQAVLNELRKNNIKRHVMSVITQTVVNSDSEFFDKHDKSIGPWMDYERAEQRRQVYGWKIVEKSGYGFRRAVPSPPPIELLEIEGIKQLINSGTVVITAGGGGIPVIVNNQGELEGVEAVVDTDQVASMLAHQLGAKVLLMVVQHDSGFLSSGIGTQSYQSLSQGKLENLLLNDTIQSGFVHRKLTSALQFLQNDGEQVIITTLRRLSSALSKESGLWIEADNQHFDLSNYF